MKKLKLRSSLLVGAAVLLFSFPNFKKGELTDIAKPYLGVYECTDAKLGEEDILPRFDSVKLELKDKGEYTLYFKEKGGKAEKVEGKYRYDKANKTITLYLPNRRLIRRAFPLGKGVLTVTVPYGDKTLRMQFEQK
ncbi:MAG: hypothetical protein E7352_02530 [Clostridiales bacterium]|nr:hypothetical protein [Clostridiales bacterium]